jgi:hypothetical protein
MTKKSDHRLGDRQMQISSAIKNSRVAQGVDRAIVQSGISCSVANKRLIVLDQLILSLTVTISDAKVAQNDERFWERAMIAVRFVKATCTLALDSAANYEKLVLAKKTGPLNAIAKGTKMVQMGIEKDRYGLSKELVKMAKPEWEEAIDGVSPRAELIYKALNGEVTDSKLVKYAVDANLDIAEKVAGEYSEKAKLVVQQIRILSDFGFEAYEIVQDYKNVEIRLAGDNGSIRGLVTQLEKTKAQAELLSRIVRDCDVPEFQSLVMTTKP